MRMWQLLLPKYSILYLRVEYIYNTNIPPQHVVKQYNNILNNIYYKNLIGITNKLLTLYTHTHTHTQIYII